MVIEINMDIDRYKESVVMGLTPKQLAFSVASVANRGIMLVLYRFIGLTPSVYVAIPVMAPIALGGFYSFNGSTLYNMLLLCKYQPAFCKTIYFKRLNYQTVWPTVW